MKITIRRLRNLTEKEQAVLHGGGDSRPLPPPPPPTSMLDDPEVLEMSSIRNIRA